MTKSHAADARALGGVMAKDPACFDAQPQRHLHPSDEKALADLWAAVLDEFERVHPGRTMTLTIAKDREGRVSPAGSYTERRNYPLEDLA